MNMNCTSCAAVLLLCAVVSAQPAVPSARGEQPLSGDGGHGAAVETSTQPVAAVPPAVDPPARLLPTPRAHARRTLDSAAELARDLQEVVTFLEKGQAFLRSYGTGTHSVEENQAFLKFLETYEKELQVAKKESDALRKWVYEKGSLDNAAQP